ncbi:MAG: DUF4259 domain-containing protein [Candidatus Izimaplasma sp.]|nr:DUF4259 domain-containing protein [Candidatus Izimaplasma bacterium]
MGRWGLKPFENDVAEEYLVEFEYNVSIDFLKESIEEALTENYLDAYITQEALAALELVAVIKGSIDIEPYFDHFTIEDLQNKFKTQLSDDFLQVCSAALKRIGQSYDNELYDQLDEQRKWQNFLDILEDLEDRIM